MEKENNENITVKKESRLKGLYIQRDNLKAKLTNLLKQKKSINKDIKVVEDKLDGVEKGISHFENREILISTHFIKRYNERIGEATEEEIRKKIVTPELEKMVRILGNCKIPVKDTDLWIIVEDNKLLTIYKEGTKQN